MNNNIDVENILFWLSFVGVIIFVVKGVHATVILKIQKTKDFPQSEFVLMVFTAALTVIFVSLSLSTHKDNPIQYLPAGNTLIELHEEVGSLILYDSTNKTKSDTMTLFKIKDIYKVSQ